MSAPDIVYCNARIFTANAVAPWASAIALAGDRIVAVGGDDVAGLEAAGTVDLDGALVLPGITDAHFHTLMTGDALTRADLVRAKDLDEIQGLVRAWAEANPSAAWVLGKGWLHSAVPGGRPTAAMLDAVVPERPVLLDANDYHSGWVNTEGLRALGITRATPDPEGGEIVRGADGEPTGELKETAVMLAWAAFARTRTAAEHDAHLRAALDAMARSGITSVIDMALEAHSLDAMTRAEAGGTLTARLRGHWILSEGEDQGSVVQEVARRAREHASAWLRVSGVKIVSDGVIDSCTAAMLRPFADGTLPPPIWPSEPLVAAVRAADAAGLQVAIHAIGDAAIRGGLDAFAEAARTNGTSGRRHRIEHVEYADAADVPRFGPLGVTASMQPVHADPAIRANWAAMLGDDRAERGFRWADLEAVTPLALGTDAPTAPLEALPNLFVAATRRSALQPGLGAADGQPPLPLEAALRHMTIDAAWSCFDEDDRGSLEPGKLADLVVLDRDPFAEGPDSLLEAQVVRTVVGGRVVYEG
ncbi:MAG: amidohydrolase [Planctomycetaceae bacterium]